MSENNTNNNDLQQQDSGKQNTLNNNNTSSRITFDRTFTTRDPLRSLPLFTETLEMGASQWLSAGQGYLYVAGIPEEDHACLLAEKIEPNAMASYRSFMSVKGIENLPSITDLEEFLLTWNGNVATEAEYSKQLEELKYTGGPITKFNNDYATLVKRNELDERHRDTINRYINKMPPIYRARLLEKKDYKNIREVMTRAVVLITTAAAAQVKADTTEPMDVDRLNFQTHPGNSKVPSRMPTYEKFADFCERSEFIRRFEQRRCVVCGKDNHRNYNDCELYNRVRTSGDGAGIHSNSNNGRGNRYRNNRYRNNNNRNQHRNTRYVNEISVDPVQSEAECSGQEYESQGKGQ
ncbi:hypothetical protein GGI12_005590 [Dipsacomyces acuminosporus]|nr:hypothetical protein GGI12_005590 [Dipsacomyces acuminosporus]